MIFLSFVVNGGPALRTPFTTNERKIMARFHRLQVRQVASEILQITYSTTASLRGEASLRDQMKRAAISVVSNISEGSERGTDREFRQFLVIARASNAELTAQWQIVLTCNLIDSTVASEILRKLDQCGRMLSKFIVRLAG
jgi:four helix bundle protein